MERSNINIKGYKSTWYVIDEMVRFDKRYYLLESETYGDDVATICIREDQTVLLEDIWNGLDDVYDYLEENPLLS